MERSGQQRDVNNASQQEGELSRMWSGQTPAACTHTGGEVQYSDQIRMEGEVNDRKWSDLDRQNSVENEYNELVSRLLLG